MANNEKRKRVMHAWLQPAASKVKQKQTAQVSWSRSAWFVRKGFISGKNGLNYVFFPGSRCFSLLQDWFCSRLQCLVTSVLCSACLQFLFVLVTQWLKVAGEITVFRKPSTNIVGGKLYPLAPRKLLVSTHT